MHKRKDQTGQWCDRNNQDKSAAPKIRSNNNALERTTVFPLGAKPIRYAPRIDDDETQLLALGQTIAERDKFGNDKEANGDGDDQNDLLDDLSEWAFTDGSPLPPAGVGSDYSKSRAPAIIPIR